MTVTGGCEWPTADPLLLAYHDAEWGVPVRDDDRLFELLVLGGAQAGLSWLTVLRKREAYRAAFDGFAIERVARYTPRTIERLLKNPGIIRNRQKIAAAVRNAGVARRIQGEHGSLANYLWGFVGGRPKRNAWRRLSQLPATSRESDAMSHGLVEHGCQFAGSTICYALMQTAGMVNDHVVSCARYSAVAAGMPPRPRAGRRLTSRAVAGVAASRRLVRRASG